MLLAQMTKAAHRGLVRHRLAAEIDTGKVAYRRRIVKRLRRRRVRQVEPVLQEMDPLHPRDPNRRAAIARLRIDWLDQRAQCRRWHNPLHFRQKRRPPRRPGIAHRPTVAKVNCFISPAQSAGSHWVQLYGEPCDIRRRRNCSAYIRAIFNYELRRKTRARVAFLTDAL